MLSTEDTSEEARAFLQQRVAWFGKLCGMILLLGLIFRMGMGHWLGIGEHTMAHGSVHKHGLAALDFMAIYFVFRRGRYAIRTIRIVETLGILFGTTMMTMMALHVPVHVNPEHLTVISLAALVFVRAVFVPSRAAYTALVTAAVGIPLLAVTAWNYTTRLDLSAGSMGAMEWSVFDGVRPAALMVSLTAFNWLIMVVVCAATAKLLYGLRLRAIALCATLRSTAPRPPAMACRRGAGGARSGHGRRRQPTRLHCATSS